MTERRREQETRTERLREGGNETGMEIRRQDNWNWKQNKPSVSVREGLVKGVEEGFDGISGFLPFYPPYRFCHVFE